MAPLRTKSEGRNFEDLLSEQDRTEYACSSRTSKGGLVPVAFWSPYIADNFSDRCSHPFKGAASIN